MTERMSTGEIEACFRLWIAAVPANLHAKDRVRAHIACLQSELDKVKAVSSGLLFHELTAEAKVCQHNAYVETGAGNHVRSTEHSHHAKLFYDAASALTASLSREQKMKEALEPFELLRQIDPDAHLALGFVARECIGHRQREGWTADHDDAHGGGELAKAGSCYALIAGQMIEDEKREELPGRSFVPHGTACPPYWPWELRWWKPKNAWRNLTRAAALIVSEMGRRARNRINSVSIAHEIDLANRVALTPSLKDTAVRAENLGVDHRDSGCAGNVQGAEGTPAESVVSGSNPDTASTPSLEASSETVKP